MPKRKALGKGLAALIPDADKIEASGSGFFQCPVNAIEPNPNQPRQQFSAREMDEMVQSVMENGILTPLLVNRKGEGYQLIAGERRWRAAKRVGLDRVPVVVRGVTPAESLELALIENVHRQDLNAIEEAAAYKKLMEEAGYTQEALAKKLGRDRSYVANLLRLLKLPTSYQQDVIDGRLSMGHARVLVGVESPVDRKRLRDAIVRSRLSVHQLEMLAKRIRLQKAAVDNKESEQKQYLSLIEKSLKNVFDTKVEIKPKKKGGKIILHFSSDEQLRRLVDLLRLDSGCKSNICKGFGTERKK